MKTIKLRRFLRLLRSRTLRKRLERFQIAEGKAFWQGGNLVAGSTVSIGNVSKDEIRRIWELTLRDEEDHE